MAEYKLIIPDNMDRAVRNVVSKRGGSDVAIEFYRTAVIERLKYIPSTGFNMDEITCTELTEEGKSQ